MFHQSAIFATTDNKILEPLYRDNVTIVACKNSMVSQKIGEDMLAERVKVVNSGVAEMVRKQRNGWIYLRL